MNHDLRACCAEFQIDGTYIDGGPYGTGHINDTYAVRSQTATGPVRHILQRINHNIFKDVPMLMDNIARVTEHLRTKLQDVPGVNPERETLTIIPTTDGSPYLKDENGDYWRAYIFIEGAQTYDEVQSEDQAYQAAFAFGTFQGYLLDLPPPRLVETIPDFHHTPKRFATLVEAIDADPCNRAAQARPDIESALAHEEMTGRLIRDLEAGRLSERVTHNDTKINNVMLDDATGRGICVIDLDTVMPGLVLYDFGDQIRTTTGTAPEDEQDLSKVRFQINMYEALVKGYLDAAGSFLTAAETDYLAFCGKLITFEIGIRFLTDYLSGDVYFKTHRPGHNLDRTRTQFEMVRQMEEQEEEMNAVVSSLR
ncbi:MAG: aminoglycoside phosphotransferase family protein [Lentisphaerae bacterium]|jgi:hypothetical protein|nr:aminoglycoside phosphotransferase family protein [Lentisphaerota bacterium]MBT4820201.1 aminoglycoside phosphotransferase family protein [Lentisphaerota bacterium]MBT5607275.1 aminoglycoside phosphotransferase family protein [Lentisphaerota bacterium]MBT7058796.1 aminoglycoside phosphotransferase family protein [Lentisphaerota bacterium]MBT7842394.1 aminoglycoside phosphotransferase family protein [Lentisphaerota bacterium]